MTKHIYVIFIPKTGTALLLESIENPLCNLAEMLISVICMAVIAKSYFSLLWYLLKFSCSISHLLSIVIHSQPLTHSTWLSPSSNKKYKQLFSFPLLSHSLLHLLLPSFHSHSAKIKIVKTKVMFPYLQVAVLPQRLRLLIPEPPPQHHISTGHIVPFESIAPNYFYIIPIPLSIYLNTSVFDCCCTQSRYFHWHWAIHK